MKPPEQRDAQAAGTPPRNWDVWFGLALVSATFLAYLPCLRGQFVWDDDSWTTSMEPYYRNFSGLVALWIHPTVLQQYIPLTGTTFWLDYHLWGFHTLPYHVENIILHSLAAILFWRVLRRLQVPGAWLAGTFFALHPVMVESAAWITERKNVLSVVLFLLALLAYGKFTRFWANEKDVEASPHDWKIYAGACALFFAALLAKATTYSFPPLLLLLAWWKRGRLRWRADALPVLPFFALAIGVGLFNSWIEKHHLGAIGEKWAFTWPDRFLIAGRALWFYAGKLLWPANLCFVYPRWHIDAHSVGQWGFPIAAVGAVAALWFARNRIGRGPIVAVLFFAGSLGPLLGFMNIYFMRYSFVCDHWSYLPSLGLVALLAAIVTKATDKLKMPLAAVGFAIIVLPIFAALTWRQSAMYANVQELYETTLAQNPNATMAHINLAQYFIATGRLDDAISHLQTAVAQEPDEPIAHRKLGVALAQNGRAAEAIEEFQKAIALKPDFAGAYFSLGDTYYHQGRLADAAAQFQKAIQADPQFVLAYNNLGAISQQQGRVDEALGYFEQVVKIQPNDPNAQSTLGQALLDAGRLDEALPHLEKAAELAPDAAVPCNNFARALLMKNQVDAAVALLRQALELQPDYPDAHLNLGEALFRQRKPAEAIAEFQKVLQLDPQNAGACNSLAWVYATCPDPAFRNASLALEFAQKADQLSQGKNPTVLITLAAAYAAAGRPLDASAAGQRALDLAAQTSPASVPALRQQLARILNGPGNSSPTNPGAR